MTARTGIATGIVSVVIDGETAVFDTGRGAFHHLNPAATEIWVAIEEGCDVDAIARTTQRLVPEIAQLIDQLTELGLLDNLSRSDTESWIRLDGVLSVRSPLGRLVMAQPPTPTQLTGTEAEIFEHVASPRSKGELVELLDSVRQDDVDRALTHLRELRVIRRHEPGPGEG